MMLHAEKIDDKGEKRAYRQMGRKMVPKQMGRFLGNSLTDKNRNASGWRQPGHIHLDRTDPGLIRTRAGPACSTEFAGGTVKLVECRTRLDHKERGVVFLSKTLHLHCLVLVRPRQLSPDVSEKLLTGTQSLEQTKPNLLS